MKRGLRIVFCLSLVLILSLSLVSAGWFDWVGKITGHAIPIELSDDFCDDAHLCLEGFKCDKEIQKCVKQVQSSGGCLGISIPCFKLKDITSCKNQQGCSWGTITANAIAIENPLPSSCSGTPKSCEDFSEKDSCANQQGCSWKEICVPNCEEKECGNDGCGGSCGECEGEKVCFGGACKLDKCLLLGDLDKNGKVDCNDFSFLKNLILQGEYGLCGDLNEDNKLNVLDIVLLGNQLNSEGIFCSEKNIKDSSKYFNDQVFLISDKNWKDVLPLVPLTTWTQQQGDDSECQRGYGTAEGVCVYPTLIYKEQEELNSFNEEELREFFSTFRASFMYRKDASHYLGMGVSTEEKCNIYGGLHILEIELTEGYSLNVGGEIQGYIKVKNCFENGEAILEELYFNAEPEVRSFFEIDFLDNIKNINLSPRQEIDFKFNIGFIKPLPESFDIDSSIYFMQQYNAKKVTIVSETPQELDNLLIAEPELGAGINQNQIQRIKPEDYLNYWKSYKDVVYVEDNYELGLMASTYVSLLNAPLIIQGTSLDKDINFVGKNIICVGNVNRNCNENYTLDELQKKYVELTNTDKIILVNPNDLHFSVKEIFPPEKSVNPVYEIYSKTSLASPILASAKHEVIISTSYAKYEKVSSFIKSKIKNIMPYIINNSKGILRNNSIALPKKIYKKDLRTEEIFEIDFFNSQPREFFHFYDNNLFWKDGQKFWKYDFLAKTKESININIFREVGAYSFFENKLLYEESFYEYGEYSCKIWVHDLFSGEEILIKSFDEQCSGDIDFSKNLISWKQHGNSSCYYGGQECAENNNICAENKFCAISGSSCIQYSDCPFLDSCYNDWCADSFELLHIYSIKDQEETILGNYSSIRYVSIFEDQILFYGYTKEESGIYLYNFSSKNISLLNSGFVFSPKIFNNNVIWGEFKSGTNQLVLYDILNEESKVLSENVQFLWEITTPFINEEFVVWKEPEGIFYKYDLNTGQKQEILNEEFIYSLVLYGNDLFYIQEEYSEFYIYGFLTVMASPVSVEYSELLSSATWDNKRSLDSTEYADIYLGDRYPDLAVGRIQGITISDVSSYVARDLFYNYFEIQNSFEFLTSSFNQAMKLVDLWTKSFLDLNYTAHCSVVKEDTDEDTICDVEISGGAWPLLWKNKSLIVYMGHGNPTSSAISYLEIPPLTNSLVVSDACLTCSTYDKSSFCNHVIRKGAISHMGAVSTAFSRNKIYWKTLNGIYFEDLTLGESFAQAYESESGRYMTTLFGDPTFKLNLNRYLGEPLLWYG